MNQLLFLLAIILAHMSSAQYFRQRNNADYRRDYEDQMRRDQENLDRQEQVLKNLGRFIEDPTIRSEYENSLAGIKGTAAMSFLSQVVSSTEHNGTRVDMYIKISDVERKLDALNTKLDQFYIMMAEISGALNQIKEEQVKEIIMTSNIETKMEKFAAETKDIRKQINAIQDQRKLTKKEEDNTPYPAPPPSPYRPPPTSYYPPSSYPTAPNHGDGISMTYQSRDFGARAGPGYEINHSGFTNSLTVGSSQQYDYNQKTTQRQEWTDQALARYLSQNSQE